MARNAALRAAAEVVGKLGTVLLFAVIARRLGASVLGDYVFATSLAQIVWAIAGFGLDRMMLRDIARDRGAIDREFFDITVLKALAGITGVGIAAGAVALLGYSERVIALVAIVGVTLVLGMVLASPQIVFQAYERMEYYFYSQVPNKLLAALAGLAVVLAGGTIVAVAWSLLAAAVVSVVVGMWLLYRNFARPQVRIAPRGWPGVIRSSTPFGLQEVFGQIVFRIDIVLLSLLSSATVVGFYGASYRLLEATLFLAWSVGTSVLPMFSYLKPGDSPSLAEVYEGSLKLITVVMVPIAVPLLVCASAIIDLVYGLPQYEASVDVLRWLAFAIVAFGAGHIAGILVLVRRRGRLTVYGTAFCAVFNIVLNLVLIPPYGANGAAAATLATEIVLASIAIVLARRPVGWPSPWRVAGGPFVAGAAMAGAMLPFAGSLAIALPLGVVVYLAVLYGFERRSLGGDADFVRSLLRSRAGSAATEPPIDA